MGRYSSVQSFTDKKTKVVGGYKEAEGGAGAGGGGGARPAPPPPRPEKVDNVSGSSAGAGSCDFHVYRAARNREIVRLEQLESTRAQEAERAEFAARVEENRKEADARTRKNAEKRNKRKLKKLLAKERASSDGAKRQGEDGGGSESESEIECARGSDHDGENPTKKRA